MEPDHHSVSTNKHTWQNPSDELLACDPTIRSIERAHVSCPSVLQYHEIVIAPLGRRISTQPKEKHAFQNAIGNTPLPAHRHHQKIRVTVFCFDEYVYIYMVDRMAGRSGTRAVGRASGSAPEGAGEWTVLPAGWWAGGPNREIAKQKLPIFRHIKKGRRGAGL